MTTLEKLSKIKSGSDFLEFYKGDTLIGCACDIQEVVALAKAKVDIQQSNIDAMRFEAAKAAMVGLIANAPNGHLSNSKEGVTLAVNWADALIAELQKTKP